MSAKFPMSQGRRTPLTLNAQPKQQAQQGNRRPSTSKVEQNRQHQQQHQTKEDKKETVDITAKNANTSVAASATVKDIQNTATLNNGSAAVVGNGNNVVANGNNKAAVVKAAVVAQEPINEKKETRNRAVKQQPTKNDVQQVVKNVVAKNGAESITKTATPPSPSLSQRKQQQQQQDKQEQKQQQDKQEQKQQQDKQEQKQQHGAVIETKVSTPLSASTKKPVEEKAAITKHQKPQNENKSSAEALFVDETTSKQTENAPVIDTKSTVEKIEPETRSPSAKDVKHADVQTKDKTQMQYSKAATPTKPAELKAATSPEKSDVSQNYSPSPVVKHTVTSCIDADDNGDEIPMNVSPTKKSDQQLMAPPAIVNENPNATSTPGKSIRIFEMQTLEQHGGGNEPLRNFMISGRRSIRPITDWTPTRFDNNPQFRGSYRRIKTELDSSMDTNTSLNVTVGSEPADKNSSWFSFRSRKRERTPTNIESVKEAMLSPPKRARFGGIFSVMASPLTALRSRFSKASINNNAVEKLSPEKGVEVEEYDNLNISLENSVQEESEVENISPEVEQNEIKDNSPQKEENAAEDEKSTTASNEKMSDLEEEDLADISITETPAKKSCNVM